MDSFLTYSFSIEKIQPHITVENVFPTQKIFIQSFYQFSFSLSIAKRIQTSQTEVTLDISIFYNHLNIQDGAKVDLQL